MPNPAGTVTLCGSTRFADALTAAEQHLTACGHIVLGLGVREPGDDELSLARKHFAKIDASSAIYVVNVGGHVGESTTLEIAYAEFAGRTVRWMFPDAIPDEFQVPLSARSPLDTTAGLARRVALGELVPDLLAGYVGGPPRAARCATCGDAGRVREADGMGVHWRPCPDCPKAPSIGAQHEPPRREREDERSFEDRQHESWMRD